MQMEATFSPSEVQLLRLLIIFGTRLYGSPATQINKPFPALKNSQSPEKDANGAMGPPLVLANNLIPC